MRRMIGKLSLLAAVLAITAVPVLAADSDMDRTFDQGQQGEKNECLLVAINCGNQVDSIQQRIERIKGEIDRGTDVYTTEELQRLNRQLDEAVELMESQSFGG